ncbi:MAG: glycerol-3-phosphate 1-O-acyltransferase PlsY [Candidatus Margulisiibacteriota bacterium]
MDYLILVLLAYLIGSVPFGIILGWFNNQQDIRSLGTKNAGASNTFLVVGPMAAVLTALLDIAKGFIPAAIAWSLFKSEAIVGLVCIATVAGHIWPVFFHFKGGKGVSTATGALLFVSWKIVLITFIIWALLVVTWRYVTMCNVIAFLIIPVLSLFFGLPNETIIFMIALAALIIISHHENITKYFHGEEKTIIEVIRERKEKKG